MLRCPPPCPSSMSDKERSPQQPLFRQEALNHHARPEARGSLLQIQPLWARLTFWIIVVAFLLLSVAWAVVSIDDYATGPVFMKVKGLEDVTVTSQGRVSQVFVTRGQRVQAGQPLMELHANLESVERDRMMQEFRTQLAAGLADPLNTGTRQTLATLRTQVEMSEARLSERTLRAPISGRVHDVRVRPNQFVGPGQVVVSILEEQAEVFAMAMVPGQFRPMVKPGQPMRLEISGFPFVYQDLEVTSVSDELVGPAEMSRVLGPGLGDAVTLQGPHVVVEGRLHSPTFEVDGRTYNYYTGMPGTAWVKVRARKGWLLLLPILEMIRKDHG